MRDRQPLLLLLLPARLESFERRALAEELLKLPRVVAIEPPRVSYRSLNRLPRVVGAWLAFNQAKRMKLPGEPRAAALFDPLQYPLARGVLARHPGCELWYGCPHPPADDTDRRLELHELAAQRAELLFADATPLLWQRLRSLGIS